ncbi:hypothetical protein PROPHIT493_8 [Mycobacterium phage prophiT49-3]|nr:hypothetical protein PROPHIT493_8 [Mycobacterium phage prophiT49-3]
MDEDVSLERSILMEYSKWLVITDAPGVREAMVDAYLGNKYPLYEPPTKTEWSVHPVVFHDS